MIKKSRILLDLHKEGSFISVRKKFDYILRNNLDIFSEYNQQNSLGNYGCFSSMESSFSSFISKSKEHFRKILLYTNFSVEEISSFIFSPEEKDNVIEDLEYFLEDFFRKMKIYFYFSQTNCFIINSCYRIISKDTFSDEKLVIIQDRKKPAENGFTTRLIELLYPFRKSYTLLCFPGDDWKFFFPRVLKFIVNDGYFWSRNIGILKEDFFTCPYVRFLGLTLRKEITDQIQLRGNELGLDVFIWQPVSKDRVEKEKTSFSRHVKTDIFTEKFYSIGNFLVIEEESTLSGELCYKRVLEEIWKRIKKYGERFFSNFVFFEEQTNCFFEKTRLLVLSCYKYLCLSATNFFLISVFSNNFFSGDKAKYFLPWVAIIDETASFLKTNIIWHHLPEEIIKKNEDVLSTRYPLFLVINSERKGINKIRNGDLVFIVGANQFFLGRDLTASFFSRFKFVDGENFPKFFPQKEIFIGNFIYRLRKKEVFKFGKEVGLGGIAASLLSLLSIFSLGVKINIPTGDNFIPSLFGEDPGRYLVVISEEKVPLLEKLALESRIDLSRIGTVEKERVLNINDDILHFI